MREQHLPRREQTAGPGGPGNLFDNTAGAPVMVGSGVHWAHLPVAGQSAGEIRARFADLLDIAPDSQATIDGRIVGDDVVVRTGQTLRFFHKIGEKGSGRARFGSFEFARISHHRVQVASVCWTATGPPVAAAMAWGRAAVGDRPRSGEKCRSTGAEPIHPRPVRSSRRRRRHRRRAPCGFCRSIKVPLFSPGTPAAGAVSGEHRSTSIQEVFHGQ